MSEATNELIVLSEADVEACLPMADCIVAMRAALLAASTGEAHNPLRSVIVPPFDAAPGLMAVMPAVLRGDRWLYGLKEVCVFPGNHARDIDSHQGSVLLHDGETGRLVAIVNGTAVTAIRTAAATAAASELLARSDASVLGLVGAGHQARWHLEALAQVHNLSEVRVCASRLERAAVFAERWRDRYPIVAVDSVAGAVAGADIVTTVTTSAEPIVQRKMIASGTHINAVGSSVANRREIDTATLAAARLFVDRRESTVNEAGDFLLARAEDPSIGEDHIIAEIGELLAGTATGRQTAQEITMFKSLGLAVEDVAAAEVAVQNAAANGRGTRAPF